jgi:hypothetical protein
MHLENGKRMGKALIKEVRCPVPGCEASWEGEVRVMGMPRRKSIVSEPVQIRRGL